MSARDGPSSSRYPLPPARNDGGPPPGYGGGGRERDRSPPPSRSSGGFRDRDGEYSRGGRDEYPRGGGRGGYGGGDRRDEYARGGGGGGTGYGRSPPPGRDDRPPYPPPSSSGRERERDYGRPSTREAFDAPYSSSRGGVPPPRRRSRSPPRALGGSDRRRSRSPPPRGSRGGYDYPSSAAASGPPPPVSAARLKGDSAPSAARLKGDSAPARRAPTPPPAKEASRTPPPMGQVEGVDGEWVEDSDGEFDNGLEDGEEDEMAKMMGFGGFGSSKGKHVPSNVTGAVQLHKPRTWRQYMNRAGGFNRPLAKTK